MIFIIETSVFLSDGKLIVFPQRPYFSYILKIDSPL